MVVQFFLFFSHFSSAQTTRQTVPATSQVSYPGGARPKADAVTNLSSRLEDAAIAPAAPRQDPGETSLTF